MVWCKGVGLAIGVLALVVVCAAAYGTWCWAEGTKALRARLEAARLPPATTRYDARDIESLPAPVQRFFRAVLKDGQPMVTAVSLEHSGTMNMSTTAQRWNPFTSMQRVITRRPGFDWDARIMMLPGVPVHVHDAYIAGAGLLRAAVFGLVRVASMQDTPEMAKGELLRFFAECAWYPTALLPSQGVRWEAVDDSSARATLVDGATSATLTFRFQADGSIGGIRAESRGRAVDGVIGEAPWEGRFWNYETRDGMRIPIEGEIAWMLAEGPWPYWRGRTTALAYEFAP